MLQPRPPKMSPYGYRLAIEEHRDRILDVVGRSRVCIVRGPTGCGKSTYIPHLLATSFPSARIAIVEPRRIAVTSLHRVLSGAMEGVGYKMRFSKSVGKETRTVVYTDGSFLNEIGQHDFDYVIVDEVHERSIRTDIILGLLKRRVRSSKEKVILMSATVDIERMSKYFDAAVLDIPGQSHPVRVEYLGESTSDYIVELFAVVKRIVSSRAREEAGNRDILVFLPGEEDIDELYVLLRKLPVVKAYKIFSALGDKEQSRIYDTCSLRKVILSTNICETSLTIPGIGYVVDTGLHKVRVHDQVSYLGIQPISKESADQRLGRCNRTGPGTCYRLYPEHVYNALPEQQIPEICRSDLSQAFLQLVGHGKNPLRFEFLDYPTRASAVETLRFLTEKKCISISDMDGGSLGLGASSMDQPEEPCVDNVRIKVTGYGRLVLRHPFDVHLSHFYQQALDNGVGYLGSILASLASQDNYNFLRSKDKAQKTDVGFLIWLFEGYLESEDKKQYCAKHDVSGKHMETARRVWLSLNRRKGGDVEAVERIFSRAYQHNLCERMGDGSYRHLRSGDSVWIHPSSCFFKRKDKFIVFMDIFHTAKAYARLVGRYFRTPGSVGVQGYSSSYSS